eukprot:COSAG01_NODE_414_length_17360_cov_226.576907_17_plen_347_part_00
MPRGGRAAAAAAAAPRARAPSAAAGGRAARQMLKLLLLVALLVLAAAVPSSALTASNVGTHWRRQRLPRHRSSSARGGSSTDGGGGGGGGGSDGGAAPLITQRWVGAQSQDGVTVSDMSCTFDVPLDSQIGELPQKGHGGEAHYIYCDLHHGWPGGVFGQFVPQLQRGMATSAANDTTHVLQDIWLDTWHIQAQYIFSIPPPHLPEPVLGAVGELVSVSPGDHLRTHIRYDEEAGAWVLQIGVVEGLGSGSPPEFVRGKTSTLKVTTPFMGVNPLFAAPYKGNKSCADYHQFILGDLHEAWNMNTAKFCEVSPNHVVIVLPTDHLQCSCEVVCLARSQIRRNRLGR